MKESGISKGVYPAFFEFVHGIESGEFELSEVAYSNGNHIGKNGEKLETNYDFKIVRKTPADGQEP